MGLSFERILLGAKSISARWLKARKRSDIGGRIGWQPLQNALIQIPNGKLFKSQDPKPYRIEERFDLDYRELTEKDFSTGEKKVFGRIIDM
jgi:hypothetical protein